MASKLTKVLNDIEAGRQDCIEVLKGKGYMLSDNSSFLDIATACATLDENNPYDTFEPGFTTDPTNDPEIYRAPGGLPDIREYAGTLEDITYNGDTYCPTGVILVEREGDDIRFAPWFAPSTDNRSVRDTFYYQGSYGTSSTDYRKQLIVLSDGTILNVGNKQEATTHVWDKTKDIILHNIHYAYIVFYVLADKNSVSSYDPMRTLGIWGSYYTPRKILYAPLCKYMSYSINVPYDDSNANDLSLKIAEMYIEVPLTSLGLELYNSTTGTEQVNMSYTRYSGRYYTQQWETLLYGPSCGLFKFNKHCHFNLNTSFWYGFNFNTVDYSLAINKPTFNTYLFNCKYIKIDYVPTAALATGDQWSAYLAKPIKYLEITKPEEQELTTGNGFQGFNNLVSTNILEHLHIDIPLNNGNNRPFGYSFGRMSAVVLPGITALGANTFMGCSTFSLNCPNVIVVDTSTRASDVDGIGGTFIKVYLPNCSSIKTTSVLDTGSISNSGALVGTATKYLDIRNCTNFIGSLVGGTASYVRSQLQLVRLDSLQMIDTRMFIQAKSLRYVAFAEGVKGNIYLQECFLITKQCIEELLTRCAQLEEDETYTITLPYTVKGIIDPALIKAAENKGWVIK